jgi:hypothetical protein
MRGKCEENGWLALPLHNNAVSNAEILVCLLKARIIKPAETTVARQWFSISHVIAVTDKHPIMEETFCERSVPSL